MKKNNKRLFIYLFIIVEIFFLVAGTLLVINSMTTSNLKTIIIAQTDWVNLVAGLGISIAEWIILFRKDKTKQHSNTNTIKVDGGSPQIIIGKNGKNIQATTYIEKQEVDRFDNVEFSNQHKYIREGFTSQPAKMNNKPTSSDRVE